MLGKQCHKPDHTYGLMVYSTHKNGDDLGMVYPCFNNINLKLGYCGIVTPYIRHHSSDGEQWGRYILPIATWNVKVVYWSKPWDNFHSASWKFHHQTSCVFSVAVWHVKCHSTMFSIILQPNKSIQSIPAWPQLFRGFFKRVTKPKCSIQFWTSEDRHPKYTARAAGGQG